MVVVAIIGILATIAVPNFQKFQARSKQTNAKAELTSIFTAQKSFYAEYSSYSPYLPSIGFVPEGVREDNIGFSPRPGVKRYYGVSSGATYAEALANMTGTLLLAAPTLGYLGAYPSSLNLCNHALDQANVYGANAGVTPTAYSGVDNFTAQAVGCPLDRAQTTTRTDVWWINSQRVMTNNQSGLN